VPAGGRIYVSVRNEGQQKVYVSVLGIGTSGSIAVLTNMAPGGYELAAGDAYTLGRDTFSKALKGQPLSWPRGLEEQHARPETMLVVVTSDRLDLSPLEQPGHQVKTVRTGRRSPLQDMIDQLDTGGTRDVEPEQEHKGVHFDIHAIDFTLERP
jgi:hypothetical protein